LKNNIEPIDLIKHSGIHVITGCCGSGKTLYCYNYIIKKINELKENNKYKFITDYRDISNNNIVNESVSVSDIKNILKNNNLDYFIIESELIEYYVHSNYYSQDKEMLIILSRLAIEFDVKLILLKSSLKPLAKSSYKTINMRIPMHFMMISHSVVCLHFMTKDYFHLTVCKDRATGCNNNFLIRIKNNEIKTTKEIFKKCDIKNYIIDRNLALLNKK